MQNSISIKEFKERGLLTITSYGDDMLITNRIEDLEPFKHPCRLEAITVVVCVGGMIDCNINLHHYEISKHTVLVIFAGDIVKINWAKDVEAYAVLLSSRFLDELQIDFSNRASFYINMRVNAALRFSDNDIAMLKPYYPLLKYNIEINREESHEVIKGLVRAFSYTIISLMRREPQSTEDQGNVTREQQIFDRFINLLGIHHMRQRSVKFYANEMCITPKYLSHTIKGYSGKSPLEWINDYVLLEAKIMLRHGDVSIKEIAYNLNFLTQSAFGKYFRQQLGIGPKAYRKQTK